MKGTIGLAFILLMTFMFLIYYVGLRSDLGAVSSLATGVGYAYSGRTASGQPVNYPT